MGKREPDRAQLQQSRRARIKHPARDVDVRHRVAVEQNLAAPEIKQEGKNRDTGGDPGQQGSFPVPAPNRLSFEELQGLFRFFFLI